MAEGNEIIMKTLEDTQSLQGFLKTEMSIGELVDEADKLLQERQDLK